LLGSFSTNYQFRILGFGLSLNKIHLGANPVKEVAIHLIQRIRQVEAVAADD